MGIGNPIPSPDLLERTARRAPSIDSRAQAEPFISGLAVPTPEQFYDLQRYVSGFSQPLARQSSEQVYIPPAADAVYMRTRADRTREAVRADEFRRYISAATVAHWLLTPEQRQALAHAPVHSRSSRTADEETEFASEIETATLRLELDRQLRLDQVWAASHHAIRAGASRPGSRALATLKERNLTERISHTFVEGTPGNMFIRPQQPSAPEAPQVPATAPESRLRKIAGAVGRLFRRLV